MLKYVAKRLLLAVVTIWAVATLTFFLMNMVPGGPFLSEKAISLRQRQRWRLSTAWINRCSRDILLI